MEGANELQPSIEVEVFGEKRKLEPTFETILNFEQATGVSVLDPANWNGAPKLSLMASLLWAACGGKNTGKTVADFYPEMDQKSVLATMSLVLLIDRQFRAAEKNDGAA